MNKINLLNISPFPWQPPFHGGQHRVFNIVKKYKDLGIEVQSIGINPDPHHYRSQANFIPCDEKLIKKYSDKPWQMSDYYFANEFIDDKGRFQKLSSVVKVAPEVIQIEHPWLFKFGLKFAESLPRRPRIVYSSHNIEHQLKEKLLRGVLPTTDLKEEVEKVRLLEEFSILNSDYIVCCTENDANYARQVNPSATVLVCPNGVRSIRNIPRFDITLPEKYAIFCGSGHPPNVKGLYEMFSKGLGCVAPDQRLIIVGSVGHQVMLDQRFDKIPNFRKRTVILGEVEENLMNFLLSHAHVVILPLTVGGGSSLKTAEALYLGKWVVATECALRGFEKFSSSAGVLISKDNERDSFSQMLRKAFDSEPLHLSSFEKERRESLLWTSTLKDLIKIVS